MNISGSHPNYQSSRSFSYQEETQLSLQAWASSSGSSSPSATANLVPSVSPSISDAGRALASRDAQALDGLESSSAFQQLTQQVVELMTGKQVQVFPAADWHFSAASSSSWQTATDVRQSQSDKGDLTYDYRQMRSAAESTQLDASGTVVTSDGQTLHLELHLSLERSFVSFAEEHAQADPQTAAAPQSPSGTPFALKFNGTAAHLASHLMDRYFAFDLLLNDLEAKQQSRGSGHWTITQPAAEAAA